VGDKYINHTDTDEVVCPHCGYERKLSWDFYGFDSETIIEAECFECEKPFDIQVETVPTYTTYAKD